VNALTKGRILIKTQWDRTAATVTVVYRSPEPYTAKYRQEVSVNVPTEPTPDDDFLLIWKGVPEPSDSPQAFAARTADVIPTLKATVEARIGMFVERLLGLGLTELRGSVASLKKKQASKRPAKS
jgi:hypothetical protein